MTGQPAAEHVEVVDSQVHIWEAERADRPWPPDGARWAARTHVAWQDHRDSEDPPLPFTAARLAERMDRVGIGAAVLVAPWFQGSSNDYVRAVAATDPDRWRVAAVVDPTSTTAATDAASLIADPVVVAIRVLFNRHNAGAVADRGSAPFWDWAEHAGAPVMVYVPDQLHELAEVLRRHPSLRLAVDHLGLSGRLRDAAVAPEIDELVDLAEFDQVNVKASALPAYCADVAESGELIGQVRRVIDAYGPQRVFWGSDLTRSPGGYATALDLMGAALGPATEDRTAVMGAGLRQWLRWPVDRSHSNRHQHEENLQ